MTRTIGTTRLPAALAVLAAALLLSDTALAAPAALADSGARTGRAAAPAGPPELYFTTFSPPALRVATYAVAGGRVVVGTPRTVARLPGACGLEWAPDGDLIVGGETSGTVFKVHPADGSVQPQPAGIPTAYELTLSPDGTRAYTAGLPGDAAVVPLQPFGPGTRLAVHGDDQSITALGFAPAGAFYTTGNRRGTGNFGTFDLATGATTRTITELRGAHGMMFDPFKGDLIVIGSFAIAQIDPAHPSQLVSQRIVPGMNFDQGLADGHGHLLLASNTGSVVYVDYSASGKVGDAGTAVSSTFLDPNLDDVVVTSTLAGAAGTARSSGSSRRLAIGLGAAVVLVAALAVALLRRRPG